MSVANIQNPALTVVPVTPSDSATLTPPSKEDYGESETMRVRAIIVGTAAGDVKFTDCAGTNRTVALPVGWSPIDGVSQIFSTGTTATGISVAY